MITKTLKPTSGTHHMGHTIHTTYNALKAILGEPTHTDIDGKIRYYWAVENAQGIVFTIYDWKMYPFNEDAKIGWHIGAHSEQNATEGLWAVANALYSKSLNSMGIN